MYNYHLFLAHFYWWPLIGCLLLYILAVLLCKIITRLRVKATTTTRRKQVRNKRMAKRQASCESKMTNVVKKQKVEDRRINRYGKLIFHGEEDIGIVLEGIIGDERIEGAHLSEIHPRMIYVMVKDGKLIRSRKQSGLVMVGGYEMEIYTSGLELDHDASHRLIGKNLFLDGKNRK